MVSNQYTIVGPQTHVTTKRLRDATRETAVQGGGGGGGGGEMRKSMFQYSIDFSASFPFNACQAE